MATSSDTTVKRVILRFEVQSGGVNNELEKIKQKSKETADGMGAQFAGAWKSIKSGVGFLGELNQALELAGKAMELVEQHGHKMDLQAAAAGISIDRLASAAKGLKTNMELLEHAAALSRGSFKLTQEQMEQVEGAMYALEEEGRDAQQVWSAMEAALTKGVTRPLEQLGIIVDTTGLKMDENGLKVDKYHERQQALARIMEAVSAKAKDAEGAVHDEADAMQASTVQLKNYYDKAKDGLAELVLATKPLLDGLARAVQYATELANKIPGGGSGLGKYVPGLSLMDEYGISPFGFIGGLGQGADEERAAAMRGPGKSPLEQFGARTYEQQAAANEFVRSVGPEVAAAIGGALKKTGSLLDANYKGKKGKEGAFDLGVDYSKETHVQLGEDLPILKKEISDGMLESAEQIDAAMHGVYDSLLTIEEQYANFLAGQPTILEKLGLDDEGLDGWSVAKSALNAFSSSYVEAMRGIAQGSMDAEGALKKVLGSTVAAVGDQLLAMGAAALAEAIALTVQYNPAAGLKYAAAGIYTAGGMAAHVAAAALSGGSAAKARVPTAPTAPGYSGGSAGSRAGGGGSITYDDRTGGGGNTIVVGDAFADDSPRMRQIAARRLVDKALGSGAMSNR